MKKILLFLTMIFLFSCASTSNNDPLNSQDMEITKDENKKEVIAEQDKDEKQPTISTTTDEKDQEGTDLKPSKEEVSPSTSTSEDEKIDELKKDDKSEEAKPIVDEKVEPKEDTIDTEVANDEAKEEVTPEKSESEEEKIVDVEVKKDDKNEEAKPIVDEKVEPKEDTIDAEVAKDEVKEEVTPEKTESEEEKIVDEVKEPIKEVIKVKEVTLKEEIKRASNALIVYTSLILVALVLAISSVLRRNTGRALSYKNMIIFGSVSALLIIAVSMLVGYQVLLSLLALPFSYFILSKK